MTQPTTQTRKVHVYLTREQAQLMDQERHRLRTEYDVKLSANEFFQLLIEMHRLRLKQLACEDSDAVPWMHRFLAEDNE